MPVLARLKHCLIAMYFHDHNPPHFHVLGKDGREAEILIDGLEVRRNKLDRKALKEALDWAQANEAFLKETWDEFQDL